ncbi:MAG: class I SAM-dependent methyltransferase [Hyphomicrobiaceae bacterium]
MVTGIDPGMRRQTPLAKLLVQRIREQGAISVLDYIETCLTDPIYGYYTTQTAIGSDGDFITAPEISQVFGELIGVWCVLVWQQMERPDALNLVELGPGRGTLMADALRALAKVPGLAQSLRLHLIESSDHLSHQQDETLAGLGSNPKHWRSLEEYCREANRGSGPAIIIANEFLDALGITQWIAQRSDVADRVAWHQRRVGVDDAGLLQFEMDRAPTDEAADLPPTDLTAEPGEIFEFAPAFDASVVLGLKTLAERGPLAGLFIDYGHTVSATGETLQAVRNHTYEHPLSSPGEADLTAQVDFAMLTRLATSAGLAVDRPVTQAEFLGRLGVVERTSRLMSANPAKAATIEAGTMRLLAPNGMGTRFKAITLRSPGLAPLPCFQLD